MENVIINFQSQIDGINKAISALQKLQAEDRKLADEFIKTGQKAKQSTDQINSSLGGLNNTLKNIAGSVVAAFGVQALVAYGKEAVALKAKMESLQNTFNFAFGSAAEGAKAMEFVRQLSNKLGLELISTADAFKKFSASTVLAGLSTNDAKKIFSQVSTAVSAMGLSADEAQGVFLALSQMMSKGTIQAEELRGQLGERLPGAFSLFAKSIGVSDQKLNKMLQNGEVLAKDTLPKFAQALEDTFSDAATKNMDSTQAKLNRLENAFTDIKMTAGTSLVDFYDWLVKINDKIDEATEQDKGGLWSKWFGTAEGEREREKAQQKALEQTEEFKKAQAKAAEDAKKARIEEAKVILETIRDSGGAQLADKEYLLDIETQLIKDAGKEQTMAIFKEYGIQTQVKEKAKEKSLKQIEAEEKAIKKAAEEERKALQDLEQFKIKNIQDERERLIAEAEFEIKNLKGSKQTQAQLAEQIQIELNRKLAALYDEDRQNQQDAWEAMIKVQEKRKDDSLADQKDHIKQMREVLQEQAKEQDKEDEEDRQQYLDEQAFKKESAIEFGNLLFDLNANAREHELNEVKALFDAKKITEEEYARKIKQIKREQAVNDKAQAIFNIGIKTAENIVKFVGNPFLVALAASVGALQTAVVLSKPIPFAKGTKRVPGVDRGYDEVHAILQPGEMVLPTKRVNEYRPILEKIFDAKIPSAYLNKLATGEININGGVDEYVVKRGFEMAMENGIKIKNFPKEKERELSWREFEYLQSRGMA